MLRDVVSDRKYILGALILLLPLFLSVGLRLLPLRDIQQQKNIFFYKEKPILTTNDGYYYLNRAKHFSSGIRDAKTIAEFATKTKYYLKAHMLLPVAIAYLHNFAGIALEWIAFFSPVFFSSFLPIIFLLWSLEYKNPCVYLVSAMAGVGNLAWYSRSCLGWFDTDGLIPLFMFIVPFFSYKFSLATAKKWRIKYGLLTLLMSLLFCFWWHRALFFIPLLIGIPYVSSIFFTKSPSYEKWLKIFIAFFSMLVLGLAATGQHLHWLGKFGRHLALVADIAKKLIYGEAGFYPSMAPGISEFSGLPFMASIEGVSGHWIIFVFSIMGLLMALREKRESILFLLCPMGMAFLGFFIRRFLIFTAPVLAFGLGFFIYYAYKYSLNFLGGFARVTNISLAAVLLYVLIFPVFNVRLIPVYSPREMAVAETLKIYPSPGYVWCWWDYGYLLEYLADKRVFVNGGTQKARRVFLSAVPFASRDYRLSANWIRFFSLRGPEGLQRMVRQIGSDKGAVAFLKKVFKSPESLYSLVKKYNLSARQNWKSFLFPKGKVYLFMPFKMLELTDWWYSFGTYNFDTRERNKAYLKFILGTVVLNKEKGILKFGSKRFVLQEMDSFISTPRPHIEIVKHYEKNISDLSLILSISARKAVLLASELKETVGVKLLFDPYGSEYFDPIEFKSFQAGAWEVKRCPGV